MLRRRSRAAWPGAPGGEGSYTELGKGVTGSCWRGRERGPGWQLWDTPKRGELGENSKRARRGKGDAQAPGRGTRDPGPGTSGGLAQGFGHRLTQMSAGRRPTESQGR